MIRTDIDEGVRFIPLAQILIYVTFDGTKRARYEGEYARDFALRVFVGREGVSIILF
jgi:hypothetical protein